MWIVTAVALFLAHYLAAQGIAWLANHWRFCDSVSCFEDSYNNSWFVLPTSTVLDCAIAAVAALKRWTLSYSDRSDRFR